MLIHSDSIWLMLINSDWLWLMLKSDTRWSAPSFFRCKFLRWYPAYIIYDGIQLISYALGAEYIPAGGIFGHHTLSGDGIAPFSHWLQRVDQEILSLGARFPNTLPGEDWAPILARWTNSWIWFLSFAFMNNRVEEQIRWRSWQTQMKYKMQKSCTKIQK